MSGGILNGKAIELPHPVYPSDAREAKIGGTATVLRNGRRGLSTYFGRGGFGAMNIYARQGLRMLPARLDFRRRC